MTDTKQLQDALADMIELSTRLIREAAGLVIDPMQSLHVQRVRDARAVLEESRSNV
jgi:hypothetical protein